MGNFHEMLRKRLKEISTPDQENTSERKQSPADVEDKHEVIPIERRREAHQQ